MPADAGELNYLLTSLCLAYLKERGWSEEIGESIPAYYLLNEIMGVLACVTQEFYRKQAVPVEEFKAQANGDLPWLRLPPTT